MADTAAAMEVAHTVVMAADMGVTVVTGRPRRHTTALDLGERREAKMFVSARSTMTASFHLFMGIAIAGVVSARPAEAGWAAPFMGGIMAGRVLSSMGEQRQEQTRALQEMAGGGGYQGGYGGYGRPMYGPPPPYYPPQLTPQQQLQQLDQLAAGGYITPQQYKERRQAILEGQ
jgi:hypothetical protein